MAETHADVDAYVAAHPPEVRAVLEEVRRVIRSAVPGVAEKISYRIPTVTLDGSPLVHFAAWQQHLAVYPAPGDDSDLAAELAPYRAARSTLRFRYRDPVPYELIGRVAVALSRRRG